jgi:hypothetical protein
MYKRFYFEHKAPKPKFQVPMKIFGAWNLGFEILNR